MRPLNSCSHCAFRCSEMRLSSGSVYGARACSDHIICAEGLYNTKIEIKIEIVANLLDAQLITSDGASSKTSKSGQLFGAISRDI